MRKITLLLIAICYGLAASAGDYESRVTEVFAKKYAEEQVQRRIAKFLNDNPHLVFSDNHSIGSESIGFLSKMLSLHNFFEAENDSERFWAGTALVPVDPTTGMLLLAVQVTEMLLSMQHQAAMSNIVKDIAELQAQTVAILTSVYIDEFNSQREIIDKFSLASTQIETVYSQLEKNGLFTFVTSESRASMMPPSELEIEEAMSLLLELERAFIDLDSSLIQINYSVDSRTLELGDDFSQVSAQLAQRYNPIREQIRVIQEMAHQIFAIAQAKTVKTTVERKLLRYGSDLRLYSACVEQQNRYLTAIHWSGQEPSYEEVSFMQVCQKQFNLGQEVLHEIH